MNGSRVCELIDGCSEVRVHRCVVCDGSGGGGGAARFLHAGAALCCGCAAEAESRARRERPGAAQRGLARDRASRQRDTLARHSALCTALRTARTPSQQIDLSTRPLEFTTMRDVHSEYDELAPVIPSGHALHRDGAAGTALLDGVRASRSSRRWCMLLPHCTALVLSLLDSPSPALPP